MQFIGNKKEAKTLVSAVRRELRKLNKPTDKLTHNECLMVMSIATGHSSWNEWEAKLPEHSARSVAASMPVIARYPLVNSGQLDFVAPGEDGIPCNALGLERLPGTCDTMAVTGRVLSASRSVMGGPLDGINHDEDSNVGWDSQETDTGPDGKSVWETGVGGISEASVVLVPRGDYLEPLPKGDWPVRGPLVDSYVEYFRGACLSPATMGDTTFDAAEAVLGFTATDAERAMIVANFAPAAMTELPATH